MTMHCLHSHAVLDDDDATRARVPTPQGTAHLLLAGHGIQCSDATLLAVMVFSVMHFLADF